MIKKVFFSVLILTALVGATHFFAKGTPPKYMQVEIAGKVINAEVADTPSKQKTGLTNRGQLDKNSGMLFVFEKETNPFFWMKNIKIPLDMIFVDSTGKIVDILSNIQPCTTTPCETFSPSMPAKYVIEVNGNWCNLYNVQIGDTVVIR